LILSYFIGPVVSEVVKAGVALKDLKKQEGTLNIKGGLPLILQEY